MKITQLRNATIVIQFNQQVILVDPMLAPQGSIPPLKYLTLQHRKNPLVALPKESDAILEKVTHCLITHCQKGHFDHLDRVGITWLREKAIPVYCPVDDVAYLEKKGLKVIPLSTETSNPFFSGSIDLIPCLHGRGLVGKMMAHGYGYVINIPNEPSLYLAGDTLLTDDVRHCITHHNPDITLIPAGGANMDIGGEIIMGLEDAISMGEITDKVVVANHLEALDHCPVQRNELQHAIHIRQWDDRYHIPADGETLEFETQHFGTTG